MESVGLQISELVSLDSVNHIDKAVAAYDETVVCTVKLSSRVKPNLTSDCQQLHEDVRFLSQEISDLADVGNEHEIYDRLSVPTLKLLGNHSCIRSGR